jgi:hypothetical protein
VVAMIVTPYLSLKAPEASVFCGFHLIPKVTIAVTL